MKEKRWLACQRDAYQREGICEVVSCFAEGAGFVVHLRDSLLYPTGGGQPADRGEIGGVRVLDVQKAGVNEVRCVVEGPVPVGMAEVRVDWALRYDRMQQHSAQHLLTALALGRLGMRTVGFHLGEEYTAIELDTAVVSEEQQVLLLGWANEAIREARPIGIRAARLEEMEALGVRSRGLPEEHDGEEVRLIEIEGIDLNTCGGTHVASTAELQAVVFVGTERIRGRVRLCFLAGGRVLQRFDEMNRREERLRGLLTTNASSLVEQVEGLQADLREAKKQVIRAEQAWIEALSRRLLAEQVGGLVRYHHEGGEMGFLQRLAAACQALDGERLVLLTAAEKSRSEGVFLLVGSEERVRAVSPQVTEKMQAKGGGTRGRFQGKAGRIEGREEVLV